MIQVFPCDLRTRHRQLQEDEIVKVIDGDTAARKDPSLLPLQNVNRG